MSTLVSSPGAVHPNDAAVPVGVRPAQDYRAPRILLDGVVSTWGGATTEILSPIVLRDAGGIAARVSLGREAMMGEPEALAALDAAVRAYGQGRGAWPTMSVAERIRAVEAFLPRMRAVREQVVRLLMWEIGKTRADSEAEFDRSARYVEDTIAALKEVDRAASRFVLESGFVAMIRRSPLGVVLCMGPFNYPLNETFGLLIPALLMGNTVVFKPPRFGTLLYQPLLDAFAQSFPPGVINSIAGDGQTIVGPVMKSGRIDVLAFIGSARVGSMLKGSHPHPNRLRCVLGLGAKNAAIVLDDADLDLAASECALGAFSYNGQRCTAIKIVFVQRARAEAFVTKLAAQIEALRVGMPWEEGVRITPLPEDGKPAWLSSLVAEAVAGGARVVNRGGGTIDETLFYPAVVYPATASMEISKVEQFGPVLPIVPFDDSSEVLDWMTASSVGQQCALFGTNPRDLAALVDQLVNQVCRVNLNSQCQRGPDTFPFGGRKDSAEGTLSVTDALRVFSIRSLVAAKMTEGNQAVLKGVVTGRMSGFLSTDFIF